MNTVVPSHAYKGQWYVRVPQGQHSKFHGPYRSRLWTKLLSVFL